MLVHDAPMRDLALLRRGVNRQLALIASGHVASLNLPRLRLIALASVPRAVTVIRGFHFRFLSFGQYTPECLRGCVARQGLESSAALRPHRASSARFREAWVD